MKTFLIFLALLLFPGTLAVLQEPSWTVQVSAESAFLRALPSTDAEVAGSVFVNDNLIAIGRNIDGQWLQVQRLNQRRASGWISRGLVLLGFDVSRLPMTDLTTGVNGPEPVVDTGVAVVTIDDTPFRDGPRRSATTLETLADTLTLPVVERTPDNQWLRVNYRGVLGWIPQFLTSTTHDLNTVPVSPEFAGNASYAAIPSVSPEVQLAQIDRLEAYLAPLEHLALETGYYWRALQQGETIPCLTYPGGHGHFSITPQDILELPELRQQEWLLVQAVDDLNQSIAAMSACGIYLPRDVSIAYGDALNAQGIFELVRSRMANARARIEDDHSRIEATPVGGG